MRDCVSVLAGPSGVGKSSIINALRAEAFDQVQRARLQLFEQKMAEEFEMLNCDEMQSDSDEELMEGAGSLLFDSHHPLRDKSLGQQKFNASVAGIPTSQQCTF